MKDFNEADNLTEQSPQQVIEKVKSIATEGCNNACDRAKEMVRKNPVPTVLGALVFGAAVGYLILSKKDSTLTERLIRESESTRRAFGQVPGRVTSLFNDGVDAASRKASKASDFLHDLPTDDILSSISNSLNRLSNRLKFW